MQGRSWKALAMGEKPGDWRTAFVAHYYRELGDTPTCVALRTYTEKLVVYPRHPEWSEIFDLASDPYEIQNLVSDEGRRSRLQDQLDAQLQEIGLSMPQ